MIQKIIIFSISLLFIISNVNGQCGAGSCPDGTVTVTANGTGITVASGKTMCLIVDGNYSLGSINVSKLGTLNICTTNPSYVVTVPSASWALESNGGPKDWTNGYAVTININCNLTTDNNFFGDDNIITIASTSTLTLTAPAASPNVQILGKTVNNGTIKTTNLTTGTLIFAGSASVTNSGTISSSASVSINAGSLTNNAGANINTTLDFIMGGSTVINNGTITSQRDFTANSGSNFTNNNYWYTKRNAKFNGNYNNSGQFQADNKISLAASGVLTFINSGIFDADSLDLNQGTLKTNATCAVFRVKHYTSISSGPTLPGTTPGSVAILDMNNPGQIDNVVTGTCGGTDQDFKDNALVTPASPNNNPAGYCGIVPISSLSGGPSGCFATLPVIWQSISAKRISQQNNLLLWTVEEKGNNMLYEVQYALDGYTFEVAGTVKPFSGKREASYSFNHENQSSDIVYYRVKQIDMDGKISYSSIVKADRSKFNEIYVTPNPGTDLVTIYSEDEINTMELFALDGRFVTSYDNRDKNVFDVSQLTKGIYFVKAYSDNGVGYTKFVKQ